MSAPPADAALADAALAADLAEAAGRRLIALRASATVSGEALGRSGDDIANRLLCDALRDRRPADGLLSEEEQDDPRRLAKERVWIVDPLDGTREYGEGRTDWAVHVGLAVNGRPVVGAVALPALDGGVVLRTDRPRPVPPPPATLRMLVSRTRPAWEAVAVAGRLGAALLPMGSAGAKAMAIVLGEGDIYLHSGGQHEWDSCAPVAVALAHGLHASRIDGRPLVYNRADTSLPDLLICRPEHAGRVLDLIAEVTEVRAEKSDLTIPADPFEQDSQA